MNDERAIAEAVEALEGGDRGCVAPGADGVLGGEWWRGREEILARLQGGPRRATSLAIRFLRSDVAVVHVRWDCALGTLVLGRSRGRWLVEAFHMTETPKGDGA